MRLTKLKIEAVVLVAALAVAGGVGLVARRAPAQSDAGRERPAPPGVEAVARADDAKNGEPAYSVKSMPPVVVRTEPQAGDTQVDAKDVTEVRVTFSKDMTDGSWSWSQVSDETFPKVTGKIRYEKDQRTCVLPAKLEPRKTYVIWLNSSKFHNFKDADGRPAVPYLLVFQTKADEPAKTCSIMGTVTYRGQPLAGGIISFFGIQERAEATARTAEDGTYIAAKVPVGELRVSVKAGAGSSLPKKYAAPETSGIIYKATEGKQTCNIDLR